MDDRNTRSVSAPRDWTVALAAAVVAAGTFASTAPTFATEARSPGSPVADGRPWIRLQPRTASLPSHRAFDGVDLGSLCGQPISLVAGDLDEDGVPDLAVGCAAGNAGGVVLVYRGRLEAIHPAFGDRDAITAPFDEPVLAATVASRPEWLEAGDFDGDGHLDVITAAYRGSVLELLPGRGNGAFETATVIDLPARATAFAAGEVDRRDGFADLVVAVESDDESRLLIYETRPGGLSSPSDQVVVPGRVSGLALGQLDDHPARDLAIASDHGLLIVSGLDRLARDGRSHHVLEQGPMTTPVVAITVGDFASTPFHGHEIAALSADGEVRVVGLRRAGEPAAPDHDAVDLPTWEVVDSWTVREDGIDDDVSRLLLTRARVSSLPSDDVVIVDGGRERVAALITEGMPARTKAVGSTRAPSPLDLSSTRRADLHHVATTAAQPPTARQRPPVDAPALILDGVAPLAVIPMRLNADAIDDLVFLEPGRREIKTLVSVADVTFVVTSTADTDDGTCDADCTLREAINAANATAGLDTISFDIPGTPPHIIQPLTELPQITEAITIDGTTEPDFAGTPVILIDGVNITVAGLTNGVGLLLTGGSSTVRGLACNNFTLNSCITVYLTGGNIIEGNFLGTDASGTVAVGTLAGTNAVTSSGNTFGGTTAPARNVIAGVDVPAIEIRVESNTNTVHGNYFGLSPDGITELAIAGNAIVVYDSQGNTIGGATVADRNVIAGGTDPATVAVGLAPLDADPLTVPQDNLILGNFIGTDVTGNLAMGTASAAVYLLDAPTNTVGGAAANVIADAGLWGVAAVGAESTGNLIDGNLIGVGVDGVTPLPHTNDGVHLYVDAADNVITDNVIANGLANGVGLRDTAGTGNTIAGNRIFNHALLGIDLHRDGVTANDLQDPDVGANLLQNFPVVESTDTTTDTVTGSLNSAPSSSFTIELFASSECDASGFGEGEVPLGTGAVTTDVNGDGTFAIVAAVPLVVGELITATATDAGGNTSEFSACLEVPLFEDDFESSDLSAWSRSHPS